MSKEPKVPDGINIGNHYLAESKKDFQKLKALAEKAIEQLSDEELHFAPDTESNNMAILMQHLAGNMISRWTDFLTTDGEKPDRNRDSEFVDNQRNRSELFSFWEKGWKTLFATLESLKEDDILKNVYIRNVEHTVLEAINRALWHYSYHVGQIVYLAKHIRKEKWKNLSIPKKH